MTDRLVLTGDLWLFRQEGGHVWDAFVFVGRDRVPTHDLAEMVAEHFGATRLKYQGHRPVGPVRITIERLGRAQEEQSVASSERELKGV